MKSSILLLTVCVLAIGCKPMRIALCEPDVKGCKIIEVYDDPMQCGFVALARNGKGETRDNLQCQELRDDFYWEGTNSD